MTGRAAAAPAPAQSSTADKIDRLRHDDHNAPDGGNDDRLQRLLKPIGTHIPQPRRPLDTSRTHSRTHALTHARAIHTPFFISRDCAARNIHHKNQELGKMGVSESKIAFKQSVFKLIGDKVLQPDDDIFTTYWTVPERVDDVFDLLVGADVRVLTCTDASELGGAKAIPGEQCSPMTNLETLLYNAVAHLRRLQQDVAQPNELVVRQILNCMRILTRIMPFIFEAEHLRDWYDRFFWQPRKPQYLKWDDKRDAPTQLFDGLEPSRLYEKADQHKEIGPPLGETLLSLVIDYFFWRGLTLPALRDENRLSGRGYELKVWKTGIGCSSDPKCTAEHERNQYELVRFLLTLTSSPLYMRPDQVAVANNKVLTYLTTKVDKRVVNAINCSCLNTVMRFNPNLWSMPSGWQGARDNKKLLVLNCVQFLLVAMVYIPPEGKNGFRSSIGALFRPDDFQFIHHGTNVVISQPVSGGEWQSCRYPSCIIC